MKRRSFLFSLGLVALTGAVAGAAHRQSSARASRIVTTHEAAYLLGKVEPVLTEHVESIAAAPGGRWALVVQDLRPESTPENRTPFGEQKLWLYDALRHKTTLLHRVQDDPTTQTYRKLLPSTWFPRTKKALVSVLTVRPVAGKPTEQVEHGMVDVERPTVRWIETPSPFLSLVQPVLLSDTEFLLLEGTNPATSPLNTKILAFLSPTGVSSPLVSLGSHGWASLIGLSADEKSAYFDERSFTKDETGKRLQEHRWHAVRLRDAQLTPLSEKPKNLLSLKTETPADKLSLSLHPETVKVTGNGGRSAATEALWLETKAPGPEKKYQRALVTAEMDDADNTVLLADLSAVLYTHDGALYAVPIASLDRVAFEKLQRELALSHAKQVGLSLMMYAQDYDENFPHDPGTVKDSLFPYIKDGDTLADFVYSYNGSTELSKIEKPAETKLGYIPTSGGRAVVYADGHVRWEPNP